MRVRRTGSRRFRSGTLLEYGDDPTWAARGRGRGGGALPAVVRHADVPADAAHAGGGSGVLREGDRGRQGVGRRGGRPPRRVRGPVGGDAGAPLRRAPRARARRRFGAARPGEGRAAGRVPLLGLPAERAGAAGLPGPPVAAGGGGPPGGGPGGGSGRAPP